MLQRFHLAGVVLSIFAGFSFVAPVVAAPSCEHVFREIEGKKSMGSASTWANLRGSEGSLKQETKKLLSEAEEGRQQAKVPEVFCPDGCDIAQKPEIIFRSIPNKFLSDYSDEEQCKHLHTTTKKKPFEYKGIRFPNLEEVSDWFADFSQGKGKEGSDLYEKCPGSCSPQYHNVIAYQPKGYILRSEVICGPARDKSDNQYQLSVAYRWSCVPKA